MEVWVVTGTTESGDAVGPYVWEHLPDLLDLDTLLWDNHRVDRDAGTIHPSRLDVVHVMVRP